MVEVELHTYEGFECWVLKTTYILAFIWRSKITNSWIVSTMGFVDHSRSLSCAIKKAYIRINKEGG